MKTIILVIVCLGIGFGLGHIFLRAAPAGGNESDAQIAQLLYTCGMHPEIVTSEPGYCPICEMKLTPKKEGGAVPGAILVDPATRQNMGLATTAVDYRRISRTVRAFANVDYSEPKLFSVNLKVEGWIERLLVNYEGETVRKGQPLVEIYSPALVTAQQDFLIAHRTGGEEFSTLLAAAHQRLKNWDISEEQIERLIEKGEIMRTMTLHSPVDGVVISRLVEKGDHLEPGAELYQIADLSEVWVMAHIYEQD